MTSSAFSPDGKLFVTKGTGRGLALQVWDVATWTLLRTLPVEDYGPGDLEFSPDGRLLAGDIGRGKVRLWRMPDGAPVKELSSTGFGFSFARDGKSLLVGGFVTELFDIPSGRLLRSFNDANRGKLLPDDRFVGAVKTEPATPRPDLGVWDLRTGGMVHRLTHQPDVVGFAVTPDGNVLISEQTLRAKEPRQLSLVAWDLKSGARLWTRRASSGWGRITIAPDGNTFAVASTTPGAEIWDVRRGTRLRTLRGHSVPMRFLRFSPNGKLLAGDGRADSLGLIGGETQIWSLPEGKLQANLAGLAGGWYPATFSPGGSSLALTASDGTVKLFDLKTARVRQTLPKANGPVLYLSESQLITGEALWDLKTGKRIRKLEGNGGPSAVIKGTPLMAGAYTEVIPDGTESYHRGHLRVWDTRTGRIVRDISGFDWPLVFTPDGRTAVTGGEGTERLQGSGLIQIWDVRAGKRLRRINLQGGDVHSLAVSPKDGVTLAVGVSAPKRNEIRFFDLRTGKVLRPPISEAESGANLAISPNGKLVATCAIEYRDRSPGENILAERSRVRVRLRDLSTERILADFIAHSGYSGSLLFAPDSKRLVTSGIDGHVKFWDVRTGKLLVTLAVLPVTEIGSTASGSWIAVTPDGYFTGAGRLKDYLRWEVGNELKPAEAYRDRYHRLDKVKEAISGTAKTNAASP